MRNMGGSMEISIPRIDPTHPQKVTACDPGENQQAVLGDGGKL